MVLSQAIQDYSDYARHELGHTLTTCYGYTSWLRAFSRWLTENDLPDPPVHEISASLIRRYSYALSCRKLRPRTIRGALQAVRALFVYLVQMGALKQNPALEVRLPKKDAATRLLVNDEDLEKLLDAAGRQGSPFRCVRDRAVLSVLIFGALRRAEVLDLKVGDIDLPQRSLLVQQGKGQKSRTVYLCDEALEALREWLALRKQRKYSHDYLFCTERHQRLGDTSLPHLLEDVKAIAGFRDDPRIKPHSIRHAAATRLLRNGADIRSIQTWLGHSHLQTTAIYLHTDEEQVRKMAPLAGFRPPRGLPEGFPEGERSRSTAPQRGALTRRRVAR